MKGRFWTNFIYKRDGCLSLQSSTEANLQGLSFLMSEGKTCFIDTHLVEFFIVVQEWTYFIYGGLCEFSERYRSAAVLVCFPGWFVSAFCLPVRNFTISGSVSGGFVGT